MLIKKEENLSRRELGNEIHKHSTRQPSGCSSLVINIQQQLASLAPVTMEIYCEYNTSKVRRYHELGRRGRRGKGN